MLVPARQLADVLSQTEFVPAAFRNRPDAIAAAILYGHELGITPMQALASIHVVEGRPAPSAELMRALILSAGHSLVVHEMSGTRVRVSGLRAGRPETERVTVDWNTDMARAAGLLGRKNWQNYPRAMLMARATGDLARVLFPDVVKGLGYVAEDEADVLAVESWAPEQPDQDKPRKALQRKRKPPVDTDATDLSPVRDMATSEPWAHAEPAPTSPPPVKVPPPRQGAVRPADTSKPVEDVPLPDVQPEQPPPEAPPPGFGPPLIGPGQLRAMHAALTRELGTASTREERLAMVSAILEHPVESTKDVTRDEAWMVLDTLASIADGSVPYAMDAETGAITVDRPPPPTE
jgi:hypothetical protein